MTSHNSAESLSALSRVTLGRTGLSVSHLALGTVELGVDYGIPAPGHFGKPSVNDAIRLVHAAIDAGINFIDTARAYGSSEEVLGQALADRRDQVVLASKVTTQLPDSTPTPDATLKAHMRESLHTSLTALRTDTLDVWQIHNVDATTLAQCETLAELFDEVRRAGKVRFVGGSFYGADLPSQALTADLFDVMQVTYSVLDQRINDTFLPQAAAQNVGVIVRSILLKGALTARGDFLPDNLEELRAASRHFRELVAQHLPQSSAPQAAIAFGLAHPHIHSVLVGVRTEQEIHENIQAAQLTLSTDFLAACAVLRIDNPDLLNPGTWGIP
ncbi:MAG: aldo/keto reductase [Litorilinea sp.]